jgi:hypothetical protein
LCEIITKIAQEEKKLIFVVGAHVVGNFISMNKELPDVDHMGP